MTATANHAIELYCALREWLAFRDGYYGRDVGGDEWARESYLTRIYRDGIANRHPCNPRGVLSEAVAILACQFQISAREVWRRGRAAAGWRRATGEVFDGRPIFELVYCLAESLIDSPAENILNRKPAHFRY